MNEQPSGSETEFQPLPNSENVYRALLRKQADFLADSLAQQSQIVWLRQ